MPNTNTVDITQYLGYVTFTQPPSNLYATPEENGNNKNPQCKNRGYLVKSMLLRHKKSHVLLPIRLNYRN